MLESILDALTALLAHTQKLLARAEPGLADWEDYGRQRNQLFQRIQNMPPLIAEKDSDSRALAQVCVSVLENDRLLASKIRHHLSEISRDLMALAGQRRILSAYVTGTNASPTYHRHTA